MTSSSLGFRSKSSTVMVIGKLSLNKQRMGCIFWPWVEVICHVLSWAHSFNMNSVFYTDTVLHDPNLSWPLDSAFGPVDSFLPKWICLYPSTLVSALWISTSTLYLLHIVSSSSMCTHPLYAGNLLLLSSQSTLLSDSYQLKLIKTSCIEFYDILKFKCIQSPSFTIGSQNWSCILALFHRL